MKIRSTNIKKLLSLILTVALLLFSLSGALQASAEDFYDMITMFMFEGNGTKDNPYCAYTRSHLFSLSKGIYGAKRYIKIMRNIDFGEETFSVSIRGNHYIDGNGYTLSNITMAEGLSFFSDLNELKNITFENMTSSAPLVADYSNAQMNSVNIINSTFSGNSVRGIISNKITNKYADTSVTNCHFMYTTLYRSAKSDSAYYSDAIGVGGLFGMAEIYPSSPYTSRVSNNTLNSCNIISEARSELNLGGFIGKVGVGLEDTEATGSKFTFTGNISARTKMETNMNHANEPGYIGYVSEKNIGGIIGEITTSDNAYFEISDCHNYGGDMNSDNEYMIDDTKLSTGYMGGIVAIIRNGNVTVTECTNNTTLNHHTAMGGIVGGINSNGVIIIDQVYNRGNIFADGANYQNAHLIYQIDALQKPRENPLGLGGIVGHWYADISAKRAEIFLTDAVNFGEIKIKSSTVTPIGGLIGGAYTSHYYESVNNQSVIRRVPFTLQRCYSTGKVSHSLGADNLVVYASVNEKLLCSDPLIGWTATFWYYNDNGYDYLNHASFNYFASAYDGSPEEVYYTINEILPNHENFVTIYNYEYGTKVTTDYACGDIVSDFNTHAGKTRWIKPLSETDNTEIYPLPYKLCVYGTACPYEYKDYGTGQPFYADDFIDTGFGFATLGEAIYHTGTGYWSEQSNFYPYIFYTSYYENDPLNEKIISNISLDIRSHSDGIILNGIKDIYFVGSGEMKLTYDVNAFDSVAFNSYNTVTYDPGNIANYGKPSGRMPEILIVKSGGSITFTVRENTYSAEGYAFNNWRSNSKEYTPLIEQNLPVKQSCQLTAMWVASNPITVTLDHMGGSSSIKSVKAYYGSPYPAISEPPVRYGYKLLGYSSASSSTYCNIYRLGTSPLTCNHNADFTAYAVWDPYGDLNNDKLLSATDLVLLKQALINDDTLNAEADVNEDYAIDILDLIRLKKYVAG